jgi:hypothetical protein
MYTVTVDEHRGWDKCLSITGCIHLHRLDVSRTLDIITESPKSADPFTGKKWAMYSRIKVGDGNRKGSICSCLDRGGSIDIPRDADIATTGGGRVLDVAGFGFLGSWDAKTRRNEGIGIDGGRQNKEDYGSGEELGKHLDHR